MADQDTIAVNIGKREQHKRLIMGLSMFVVGLVALVIFLWLDLERSWRLILFLPFFLGGLGIFQDRQKT